MRIAIDAMGSDKGSQVFIKAISDFVNDYHDVEIFVFGNDQDLVSLKGKNRIKIINTTQVINMNDGLLSLRRKTDSSMNRMLDYLAANKVDGVLSAGSTAGLLTCALLKIKLITGIDRPCLIATIPASKDRYFQLLDMGANSECNPQNLMQFAILGKKYAEVIYHKKDPEIMLLNIGSESNKGDKLHKEAYELLKNNTSLNFKGNIEGRDIFSGNVDVVVTDGFSGNMTLKAMEGTAFFAFSELKHVVSSSFVRKLAGLILKKSLKNMKNNLDYSKYGGAFLIGFEQPIIKAHGSSNDFAIYNALIRLHTIIKNDTINLIKKELL